MTKQDIINYVTTTPHNTNKAILNEMLDQLAGGGSSDFAIANVTLTDSTASQDAFSVAVGRFICIVDEGEPFGEVISSFIPFGATSPYDVTVPLYKGKDVLYMDVPASEIRLAVSGNAEIVTITNENGTYDNVIITGDCEITFSDTR